jgi:hypothetical protein
VARQNYGGMAATTEAVLGTRQGERMRESGSGDAGLLLSLRKEDKKRWMKRRGQTAKESLCRRRNGLAQGPRHG